MRTFLHPLPLARSLFHIFPPSLLSRPGSGPPPPGRRGGGERGSEMGERSNWRRRRRREKRIAFVPFLVIVTMRSRDRRYKHLRPLLSAFPSILSLQSTEYIRDTHIEFPHLEEKSCSFVSAGLYTYTYTRVRGKERSVE